jgi:hypothetical protein
MDVKRGEGELGRLIVVGGGELRSDGGSAGASPFSKVTGTPSRGPR